MPFSAGQRRLSRDRGRGCNSRRLHKSPLTTRRKWLFLLKFRRQVTYAGRGFQPAALQFHASKAFHRKRLATRALGVSFATANANQDY